MRLRDETDSDIFRLQQALIIRDRPLFPRNAGLDKKHQRAWRFNLPVATTATICLHAGPKGIIADLELALEILPQVLLDGVVLGFMYALIALGYTMVYGVLEFINFAHSEIFVLGAFVGVEALLLLLQFLNPKLKLTKSHLRNTINKNNSTFPRPLPQTVQRSRRLRRGRSCPGR